MPAARPGKTGTLAMTAATSGIMMMVVMVIAVLLLLLLLLLRHHLHQCLLQFLLSLIIKIILIG